MSLPSREQTLGRIQHPDPFRVGDTGRTLELIDDPVADRLQQGDATLGWAGDERLALYLDRRDRTWDLWRLEHDGEYRCCRRLACDAFTAIEVVPELIFWLTAHDQRQGFNPVDQIVANAEKKRVDDANTADEFTEDFADRLHHALRKDGVD